jgi:V-type H+-transporting ATPase subunit D
VLKAREVYAKAVETLVELASLQAAFMILDDVIRATNRRVNAIEHVVIPRLENTIKYVLSELDEMDREEFFRCARLSVRDHGGWLTRRRLKKVQGKKKRDAAAADAAKALLVEAEENPPTDEGPSTNANLLDEKDEDVIF